ncbi:MAG: AAA family ATPase, partial [Dysgonamonadaceae bacterium]|nr:AAA family ATPase [Dysgonamonadaceae bacterium]
MIAEFTIENFRSFKEKQTFSLSAAKDKEFLVENTFEARENVRLLRSALVYGANASGKTNFFKALGFFLYFAADSGPRGQAGDPTGVKPFLFSKQTEDKPSTFELTFYLPSNEGRNTKYRYGFSVNGKKVIEEHLFAVYNVREVNLFQRDEQEITMTAYFKEGGRAKQAVRNNSSLLSVCAQNNGEVSTKIIHYFHAIRVTTSLRSMSYLTKKELQKSENREKALDFLRFADIQIKNLKNEEVPISFAHTVYDNENPIG